MKTFRVTIQLSGEVDAEDLDDAIEAAMKNPWDYFKSSTAQELAPTGEPEDLPGSER